MLSRFSVQAEHRALRTESRIDLSGKQRGEGLIEFFTETGVLGMHGCSDFKNIKLLSPIFGKFVDRIGWALKLLPFTGVFVNYVDLRNFVGKQLSGLHWNEKELQTLYAFVDEL